MRMRTPDHRQPGNHFSGGREGHDVMDLSNKGEHEMSKRSIQAVTTSSGPDNRRQISRQTTAIRGIDPAGIDYTRIPIRTMRRLAPGEWLAFINRSKAAAYIGLGGSARSIAAGERQAFGPTSVPEHPAHQGGRSSRSFALDYRYRDRGSTEHRQPDGDDLRVGRLGDPVGRYPMPGRAGGADRPIAEPPRTRSGDGEDCTYPSPDSFLRPRSDRTRGAGGSGRLDKD
jgi:hypothetical protein